MKSNVGVYLHIPFCIKKCYYCDFYSLPNKQDLQDQYVNALISEILYNSDKLNNRTISTIYFGGGTPSVLSVSNINKILDTIYRFDISNDIEITLECNPETLSFEYLLEIKNTKINRLSIGMQSMDNNMLMKIGRVHTKEKFLESYNNARKVGFDNISIDVMFGFKEQTLADFRQTIKEVIQLQPEHISCYSLILEEGTKMFEDMDGAESDDDLVVKMYDYMVCELRKNKYSRYEISNFSKEGYESKHNSSYWKNVEYLGFGASASSYYENERYKNRPNLDEYISENGLNLKTDVEKISKEDEISEFFFLGLRMDKGVSYSEFKSRFGFEVDELFSDKISELRSYKLLYTHDDKIMLTDKGVSLSNYVFEQFLL